MSSQEEDYRENPPPSAEQAQKKRRVVQRVSRACDGCRRKKVRCDGGQMPNNRCTNCVNAGQGCSYIEAAKKRGPPKAYVEGLEARLLKMEQLLRELRPDGASAADPLSLLDSQTDGSSPAASINNASSPSNDGSTISALVPTLSPEIGIEFSETEDDTEMKARESLSEKLEKLHICTIAPNRAHYFGKSSGLMLLQTAFDHKREFVGAVSPEAGPSIATTNMRPEYMSPHPWIVQMRQTDKAHLVFPERDLMVVLIEHYFKKLNMYFPLLHRPTFETGIVNGLHLRDDGFGLTVLAVCALGARFSDDQRVALDGFPSSHSAGWKWFKQVQAQQKLITLRPPRLYDVQLCALSSLFMHGSSAPHASFPLVGHGLRMAQDLGAHRKRSKGSTPSVDDELLKRAFWALVWHDRVLSTALGRPCCIQDEDIDTDFPTECDDEYWLHPDPKLAFKQPPGKPSLISSFVCFLRLLQIQNFTLRTLYSMNKSRAMLGLGGPGWEERLVTDLDSALNKWVDSIPDHLRWDPHKEDLNFLSQSALLYSFYYGVQIMVHRPFIPSPNSTSSHTFPSLAICTNAARSCIHVLDLQNKRTGYPMFPTMMVVFMSGVILLLNIWGSRCSGSITDPAKEMVNVHKAMNLLKLLEPRWFLCGRLGDFLRELASFGDLPLPQAKPRPSNKRGFSDNASRVPDSSPVAMESTQPGIIRPLAGSSRVSRDKVHSPPQSHPSPALSDISSNSGSFSLPVGSEELGRIPMDSTYDIFSAPLNGSWNSHSVHNQYTPHTNLPATQQASSNSSFNPLIHPPMESAFPDAPIYEQLVNSVTQNQSFPLISSEYLIQSLQNPNTMTSPNIPSGDFASVPMNNTLDMWSIAPSGFDWNDWGTYISNLNAMATDGSGAPVI